MTTVGALQGIGDALGIAQDFAQILPYQFVELVGRSVARGTVLLQATLSLFELARTHVVPLLSVVGLLASLGARYRAQLAPSATHQCSQQVVVSLVAPGEGFVPGELLACEVELLLAHHRRHAGHRDPLLRRKRHGGVVRMSYGAGGRAPNLGGTVAYATSVDLTCVDLTCVDGIGQYPAQCGHAPDLPAPRSRDAQYLQVPGDAEEARSLFEVHSEDLCHHCRLGLLGSYFRWIAGPVGIDPVT